MPFDLIQLHIRAELDIYESFAPRAGRFDELIATLYARIDPGKIAATLVGIGPIVGATVSAVLGSSETIAARFPNADHMVSYSGLAPKKNQTGKSNREGQHISKAGSRLLRRYFYLAAETARRRDPELAAFYARLVAGGKHHIRARSSRSPRRCFDGSTPSASARQRATRPATSFGTSTGNACPAGRQQRSCVSAMRRRRRRHEPVGSRRRRSGPSGVWRQIRGSPDSSRQGCTESSGWRCAGRSRFRLRSA